MLRILSLATLALATGAGAQQFELSGRFTPDDPATVTIYGVASPFTSRTASEDGRFTFKKLPSGAYTIAVFTPGKGEARQTVEVGPAAADSRNRIAVSFQFKESDFVADALKQQHAIPVRQLAVPEKAMREYEDAQRDLARRDVDSATRHLDRAVAIAPAFSAAWNNLGTIAYQTQRYPRAEQCFRTALEADPGSFEPLVNLGGVLVTLHKLDEAWKYNAFAVLTRPNDALANSQLGMTYFEQGQYDLAEKHFAIARTTDPAHFSHPQLFLAEIHMRRGLRRETADDLQDFLDHHPDWPQAAQMRETIAGLRR